MNIAKDLPRGSTRSYWLRAKFDLTGMTVKFAIKSSLDDLDADALYNEVAVLDPADAEGKIYQALAKVTASPAWPLQLVYYGWRVKNAAGEIIYDDQGMMEIVRALPEAM